MPTIGDSFLVRLPPLKMRGPDGGGSWEIPPIKTLASTGNFDAPKALERVHPELYCQEAAAAIPLLSLTTHLPAVEPSIFLRTEGDVVHAVGLYLLHPVNMALEAIRRMVVGSGSSIYCQSEVHQGPTARTDFVWKLTKGTKMVTLGVLELKNTQLLVEAHFTEGVVDMTRSGRDAVSMIDLAFSDKVPNEADKTCLGRSASRVSRQARKYHTEARTDFVAVFDWCSMIIFDFGGMDEGSYRLAKGTWHQEGPHLPSHGNFRMLLLGMLIKSMKRFGVIK